MPDVKFPLPVQVSRSAKDSALTVRCPVETRDRLVTLIPNKVARAIWVNDLLKAGLDYVESTQTKKKKAG